MSCFPLEACVDGGTVDEASWASSEMWNWLGLRKNRPRRSRTEGFKVTKVPFH
jgi:hypothetical protein